MIDIGGIGSFGGNLLQLKKIYRRCSGRTKYGSLVFIVGTLGVLGIFSWVPIGSVASSLQPTDQRNTSEDDERCLWKKDVAFFSALESGHRTPQEEVSCEVSRRTAQSSSQDDDQGGVAMDDDLDQTVRELTAGFPIEAMASAIAKYDREVAALIVGIAKKESNWGKRVPVDADGKDCFNYWGWKGAGARGVAMGHGCFGSPEEAVHAVGDRIAELVKLRETSEPKNLTVWKCGSSCATQSKESVNKWVSDVDMYYRKIAKK
jgi:hypothetical protein